MKPDPRTVREIKDVSAAVGLALGVHLLVALLLMLGTMNWQPFEPPRPQVQFTLVDAGPVVERQQEEEAEAERRAEEEAAQREAERREEERREEERLEEQRREQERLEEQRLEAERQEQERLETERREAERREQERREAERREAERREAEQRELEEIRRQREEAQRRREEEERRLEELAERRAEEEAEQRAREEAERRILAEQEAAESARRATLREEYVGTIRNLVTNNWIRPPTTNPGVECTVRVFQIPGGEVIDVQIASPCNADDTTRRSIIAAVNRTGDLPYRGYEDVFERELEFVFIYHD